MVLTNLGTPVLHRFLYEKQNITQIIILILIFINDMDENIIKLQYIVLNSFLSYLNI